MQTTEQAFKIGDRVALKSCSEALPGTVQDILRGKIEVIFDDLDATWILRPASLKHVQDAK
jgi:hypothetical protein